ncbi:MAG: diphthine synthase [Nanoarchaeota archaeon]|nr:diphthine synthase [Nanoarchaeota archaeon]
MAFYLIGLGLNLESISKEAMEICKKADKTYLENYTVEFPYRIEKLEDVIEKKIFPITRIIVEEESFVDEAKKKNIVLLIYGSPLTATTHISLILKCKKENINYKVFHNASILEGITETGLQIYKFGKITSMPIWKENYKPESFIKIIKENKKINAHTLLLVDIGFPFADALKQLIEVCRRKVKLEKIIVCSKLGTKQSKIYFCETEELFEKEIYPPFCFIIPGELHFLEKEALDELKEKI